MKLFIRTFGCRANQYDSEIVRSLALANGAEVVDSPADADMAVFNSCAVTGQAEADLRQSLRRAARENPAMKSFVMGCASSLELQRGAAHNGGTAAAIGSLPGVTRLFAGADVAGVAAELGFSGSPATLGSQTGARGLLRIQDGCDEHCTFCATTLARGSSRSRDVAAILEEAATLAECHPEIVITGVHIGSYGADIGTTLGHLLQRLVARAPTVRFRLSSLEATEVDERIVELFAAAPKSLAPYLHAPLQSGSNRVLKRMGRHWYTAETYSRALEKILSSVGTFGLGADVIAGFPGETPEDHQASLALIGAVPFTSLHVFPYSPRPGTAARRLGERVDQRVVSGRAAELRALASEKAAAYARKRSGGAADIVVVTGAADIIGGRTGLTEDYLTVSVSDPSFARGTRFAGTLSLEGSSLWATPVSTPS